MPMHDWTRVEPTIYHHFHQQWCAALAAGLNDGRLPAGFSALIEQHAAGLVPDVLGVERRSAKPRPRSDGGGGVATLPRTRLRVETSGATLPRRANRVAIRHRMGEVVCVIEIVSPGNKATRSALRSFVEKTVGFLRAGVNVLLVDPFPPGPRDPQSLHPLIWDEFEEAPFEMPADDPLLLAAYRTGDDRVGLPLEASLEPFRVGAALTDMPAWLDRDLFVLAPLERSYQAAWDVCPSDYRHLVEHGCLPEE